ncbi:general odorant-binding protein 69a [Drosophila pseudoobscura]|uniref:General odorant-binding protein 69a n=1 Tax=Drosophila pseudoobscura pseudoobscura TaxID=46245 RepID=Q2M0N3_DROPS|nr:general odorant-binding protein 69a [Drosophila pseudoobscura]
MTSSRNVCLFLAVLIAYDSLAPSQAFELSPTMKKQVGKLKDRCIKQTGASAERMLQAKKDQVLPDDPAFKCFLHCMFDMLGLIDSHNVMQLESLIEVLPEEIHPEINALVGNCGTQKGIDGCDTAFLTVKCYLSVNKDFITEQIMNSMQ